jgi:ferredoxin-NADP reductase
MEEYLTQITRIKYLTLEVVEISVDLIAPDDINFEAGQGMEIKIEGKTYHLSITNPPQENNRNLFFCIRVSKDSPIKDYVKGLAVGQRLTLLGPVGDFKIKNPKADMLFMAESTGIGVLSSIMPMLVVGEAQSKFKLLFQVKSEEEMFYFARFSKLALTHPNFSFTPIVVSPFSHWPGEVGTASTFVKVSGKSLIGNDVYISGHKAFVDTIADEWHKLQLDKKNIYKNIIPEGL